MYTFCIFCNFCTFCTFLYMMAGRSTMVSGRSTMVLGRSNMVFGRSTMVLGRSTTVLGRSTMVLYLVTRLFYVGSRVRFIWSRVWYVGSRELSRTSVAIPPEGDSSLTTRECMAPYTALYIGLPHCSVLLSCTVLSHWILVLYYTELLHCTVVHSSRVSRW